MTEHRDAERQIADLALHDPLANLPNRAALTQQFDSLPEEHGAQATEFAVLCLDLDRFKEVNDVFGYNVGDILLRAVADRLRSVAAGGFVARLGGDEFMLLVEGDAEPPAAGALTKRRRCNLAGIP